MGTFSSCALLAVGLGHEDEPVHGFEAPAGVDEALHAMANSCLRQSHRLADSGVGPAAVLLKLLDDRLRYVVERSIATLAVASQPETGHGTTLGRGGRPKQGNSSRESPCTIGFRRQSGGHHAGLGVGATVSLPIGRGDRSPETKEAL